MLKLAILTVLFLASVAFAQTKPESSNWTSKISGPYTLAQAKAQFPGEWSRVSKDTVSTEEVWSISWPKDDGTGQISIASVHFIDGKIKFTLWDIEAMRHSSPPK